MSVFTAAYALLVMLSLVRRRRIVVHLFLVGGPALPDYHARSGLPELREPGRTGIDNRGLTGGGYDAPGKASSASLTRWAGDGDDSPPSMNQNE